MMFVALRMLLGDRLKYIALVAGVTFAALLITQQAAIFTGYSNRIGAWVHETSGIDVWVMDDQVRFDNDFKPMQDTALQRVRGVDGVAWAVPMFKDFLLARLPDGTIVQCRVIGLDDATLVGGPPQITQGTLLDLRQDRAILISRDQAKTTLRLKRLEDRALLVGDRMSINDNEAVVVGTYQAATEFFWDPVVYTTYSRALSWAPPERKMLTYVLVRAKDGVDAKSLAERIQSLTGLKAMTRAEFEQTSIRELLQRTGILVNFGITIVLGFVIGLLVAGQTFYIFVLDNVRLFGTIKALGASNWTLMRMMCTQVVLIGAIGYGLGVGLTSIMGMTVGGDAIAFSMPWPIPVFGGIAVLLCCLVAGLIGMIRVVRLEPAIVFKS